MTARGMLLVARLEFRTRLRAGRWKVLFGVWFAVLLAVSVLLRENVTTDDPAEDGVEMFGTLLFFVLLLMMLISPALTAQTINGDRERGTLAPLQTTRLTPLEIVSGKFLAAWAVGLAVLGLALPFIAWPVLEGDVDPWRGVVCVVVTALLIGSACAVSLALSALVVRSVTSALLSYLTVFALMFGTILLFVLTMPFVTFDRTQGTGPDSYTEKVVDTRYTWWLLAPSPFVVLADAAPALPRKLVCPLDDHRPDDCHYEVDNDADVLGSIGQEVREARVEPQRSDERYLQYERRKDAAPAVWPYGLGFHLLLAGGSLAVAARRLRVPATRLPRGVRVA